MFCSCVDVSVRVALKHGKYECFLSEYTALPMMHLRDCINATVSLLNADNADLKQRTYNVSAFSLRPNDLATAIRTHIPSFEVTYKPDFRQQIADSWPSSIDDLNARRDWGWQEEYDMASLTEDMLREVGEYLKSH